MHPSPSTAADSAEDPGYLDSTAQSCGGMTLPYIPPQLVQLRHLWPDMKAPAVKPMSILVGRNAEQAELSQASTGWRPQGGFTNQEGARYCRLVQNEVTADALFKT
jgi:hypothetical protein